MFAFKILKTVFEASPKNTKKKVFEMWNSKKFISINVS